MAAAEEEEEEEEEDEEKCCCCFGEERGQAEVVAIHVTHSNLFIAQDSPLNNRS